MHVMGNAAGGRRRGKGPSPCCGGGKMEKRKPGRNLTDVQPFRNKCLRPDQGDRSAQRGHEMARKRPLIWAGVALAALTVLPACGGGHGGGYGHNRSAVYDNDNNPPGPRGGSGTNWENPPGPRGGPGASPDRRP